MKKLLIGLSLILAVSLVLESCGKPQCGTKREKKKKMKSLNKNGTFKM